MIDSNYTVGGFIAVCALVGLIYRNQEAKIADLKNEIDCKISSETCDLKIAALNKDIEHLHDLIALSNSQNAKDHSDLTVIQEKIQDGQKEASKQLSEITKCLALLSERIPCVADK